MRLPEDYCALFMQLRKQFWTGYPWEIGEALLPISVVFQSPFRNPLSLLGFICGWFSSFL